MPNGRALIEPHIPAAKPLGRPREIELRAVLDAILYIARTGCQWRMLPKDFPPFPLVPHRRCQPAVHETATRTLSRRKRDPSARLLSAGRVGPGFPPGQRIYRIVPLNHLVSF
jgi:transposase